MRDAVHARLLVTDGPASAGTDFMATVLQLSAQLRRAGGTELTPTELALLQEWLARLATAS